MQGDMKKRGSYSKNTAEERHVSLQSSRKVCSLFELQSSTNNFKSYRGGEIYSVLCVRMGVGEVVKAD